MTTRAEEEAYNRALRWVAADPHYDPQRVTQRESELMMLAIRCYSKPSTLDRILQERGEIIAKTESEARSGNATAETGHR